MAVPDLLFDVTTHDGLVAITALRERFLGNPDTDLTGLRPRIAESWRRCAAMTVDPSARFEVDPAARVDEQTLACAAPIVRELEELAFEAGGAVTLMSPAGCLVGDLTPSVEDRFPHGLMLVETQCGTNGDGTALESGTAGWVYSREHFREDWQSESCCSVPLRDPFRDNIRAVLTLTLPESVMLASDPRGVAFVVQGAAARITRELAARSSTREQMLFAEYLRVSRRYRNGAFLATDGKHTMVSDPALEFLRGDDFVVIASYAHEALRVRRPVQHTVTLSAQRRVQLTISMAGEPSDPLGAIVLIKLLIGDPIETSTTSAIVGVTPEARAASGFADLIGDNQAFRQAIDVAASAIVRRKPVHILGDRGTGKRTVARRIAGAWATDVETFDCSRQQENVPVFVEALRAQLERGAAVILTEADALTAAASARLSEVVRHFEQPPVVVTMLHPTSQAVSLTAALHTVEIAMPPLRARREDIPALATRFIADITDKRPSARLLYVLAQADWPDNVQTLRDVVEQAAMVARGTEVNVADLPQSFCGGAMAHGGLSRLEELELHELRRALKEAGGNRTLAADILQIGRSTLYRRLDSYRRRGVVL